METQPTYNAGQDDEATLKVNEQLRRIRGLEAELQVLSISLRRAGMANSLDNTYSGNRDMYKVLGYTKDLSITDYAQAYKRNEMGGRIIDLAPKDTWRNPPAIKEDDKLETPWLALFESLAKRLDLLAELSTIDRISGIGRYGVLLIGTRGEKQNGDAPSEEGQDGEIGDLSEPIGTLSGPESIIYLRSCSEETAEITEIEDDVQSPRYGLPTMYLITTSVAPSSQGDAQQSKSEAVHWSRVVHIAEDTLDDKVYGRPRLERVFNRLVDYEKVIGGASEATWLVMNRGLQADVQEGSDLTQKQLDDLADDLQDYVHGLRRIMQTSGVTIKELGGAVVNPSGLIDKITAALAAGSDIPQRILVGSERGNLASTQDQETWAGNIENRQNQYAWPRILKAFIDWCVLNGALPPHGELTAQWPPLTKETDAHILALNKIKAEIIKAFGVPVVLPNEIRELILLEALSNAGAVPMLPPSSDAPAANDMAGLYRIQVSAEDAGTLGRVLIEDNGDGWATQAESHGGVLVSSKCPLCGSTQGMRYAGHGPLVLCLNCKRTYDPTYWGHGRNG